MNKMSCYEFGRQLVETGDLDPVYVLLWNCPSLKGLDLQRWLFAYWCFYHMGTASWITETYSSSQGMFRKDVEYWNRFATAAASKEYPRCAERRHFRGANAVEATKVYRGKLFSVDLFQPLLENPSPTVAEVTEVCRRIPQFGPWISFKVADMLERLDLVRVRFDDGDMFLFDSPAEAALMLWRTEHVEPTEWERKNLVPGWAVKRILLDPSLRKLKAPPRYERKLNCQEAETILCKWKSYRNGRYHVGEDITSCRKSLLRFSKTRLCQDLLRAGKIGGLWK